MLQNAGIVLKIFAFYFAVIVLMGLAGVAIDADINEGCPTDDPACNIPSADDVDSILDVPGFIVDVVAFFFSGLFFSIGALGWFNIILFLPLGITLAYIGFELAATAVP